MTDLKGLREQRCPDCLYFYAGGICERGDLVGGDGDVVIREDERSVCCGEIGRGLRDVRISFEFNNSRLGPDEEAGVTRQVVLILQKARARRTEKGETDLNPIMQTGGSPDAHAVAS